jgi:hypothetical protein
MRNVSISMLVLLIVLAFVVVTPAFSFEAAGESSFKSVAGGCCPKTVEAKKAECDKCKDCKCKSCCKDGKCECKDDDCKCACKDSSCKKSKGSCGKGKGKGSCGK